MAERTSLILAVLLTLGLVVGCGSEEQTTAPITATTPTPTGMAGAVSATAVAAKVAPALTSVPAVAKASTTAPTPVPATIPLASSPTPRPIPTATPAPTSTHTPLPMRASVEIATPTPTVTPISPCEEGMWHATYFKDFELQGIPVLIRCESVINHDWKNEGGPGNGVNSDNFSVRWVGAFIYPEDEQVVFTIRTGDGMRLWVDGRLLIDSWIVQSVTTYRQQMYLTKGKHTIKVEHFNIPPGGAAAQVSWESIPTLAAVIPTPTVTRSLPAPSTPIPTVMPTPSVTLTPVSTPILTATPIVEEGTPIPIAPPDSSKGFVVVGPIEVEVVGNSGCDGPQLPGDTCHLQSIFVSSKAKIDQQPCIGLIAGFRQGGRSPTLELTTTSKTFNKQDGSFTLAAEGARRGQDRVLFGPKVLIPENARSGIYRSIEVVVKLPDSSGRCVEVARVKLVEQIQVEPGLELVVEKVVTCGHIAVGEECTLFFLEVVKVSDFSISQSGRLDIVFRDLDGRVISKPDGFELWQRVDGGDEVRLGTVTVKQWKGSVKVEIILKIKGGVKMIELGQPEPVLLEL